jgi:hypothetical protein
MDVELQILKHLARDAQPTVSFIDKYCVGYKDLFPEVRSYECFKPPFRTLNCHMDSLKLVRVRQLPKFQVKILKT